MLRIERRVHVEESERAAGVAQLQDHDIQGRGAGGEKAGRRRGGRIDRFRSLPPQARVGQHEGLERSREGFGGIRVEKDRQAPRPGLLEIALGSFVGRRLVERLLARSAQLRIVGLDQRRPFRLDGRVAFHRIDLTEPTVDARIAAPRRQTPRVIEGSSFTIEADLAIKALGFDPEDVAAMTGRRDLTLTHWGTLKVDWRSLMTSQPGVFAAGDIVRGASLVVWGVRDGRDAAESMHEYLQARAPRLAAAS